MIRSAAANRISLSLVFFVQFAAASDGPSSCELVEPPMGAGELSMSVGGTKIEARVYPRLSDIPKNYTGCQLLWSNINGRSYRTTIRLNNGRVESTDPPPDVPLCARGERSSVSGCYPRKQALQASFPAGCIAKRFDGRDTRECKESFLHEHQILDAIED
jgi:hypothetical protein